MPESVHGKGAVVIGGSGVIGGAIARSLAEAGANVVVGANSRLGRAEELASELTSAGMRAVAVQGDIRTRAGAQRFAADSIAKLGQVDILVNCAGATVGGGKFADLLEQDWLAAFESNVMTNVMPAEAFAPTMSSQGFGRIISITSVRGLLACGRESIMAYSAAKAALASVICTMAKDLGPEILVNAIAPGFVFTPNYESMSPELRASFLNASVTKEWVPAEDVADAALFLARSTSVTGQVLVVDGGFTLKFA